LITLGFANAARAAQAGEPVRAGQLFEPFVQGADRARRSALVRLSLLYTLAWLVTLILFVTVSSVVFSIIGAPQLAVLSWQPAMLVFVIAFYVSVLFSYADCFAND